VLDNNKLGRGKRDIISNTHFLFLYSVSSGVPGTSSLELSLELYIADIFSKHFSSMVIYWYLEECNVNDRKAILSSTHYQSNFWNN